VERTTSSGADVTTPSNGSQPTARDAPAGALRAAIIVLLDAAAGPLTITQIESDVAANDPDVPRGPVEEEVHGLVTEGLVEEADDRLRFALSAEGRKMVRGIRALPHG
jgi:hypothetical protein